MRRVGPSVRLSRGLAALVSCGFAALTLDCRSCSAGFGRSSGEAEPLAVPGVGGSFPVAETLSTAAAAVLTLVVLSAPALPFRDGSKEHQGEGGWVGRFVGPHVAGGARRAFTLRPARVHDADGPPAKRRTEASATRRD
jgi:hypothetical protein